MKILVVMVAVLALAAPATASAPSRDPRVPGLQRQVRALKGQVAALAARIDGVQSAESKLDDRTNCLDVIEFNFSSENRWLILSILAIMANQPSPPRPAPISDGGTCARAGIAPPAARSLQSAGSLLDRLR